MGLKDVTHKESKIDVVETIFWGGSKVWIKFGEL